MAKVVGIDLGTTNSVVAAIEGGQPSVYEQHLQLSLIQKNKNYWLDKLQNDKP
jgi:molecular chaperone DnaK (HSP70)